MFHFSKIKRNGTIKPNRVLTLKLDNGLEMHPMVPYCVIESSININFLLLKPTFPSKSTSVTYFPPLPHQFSNRSFQDIYLITYFPGDSHYFSLSFWYHIHLATLIH